MAAGDLLGVHRSMRPVLTMCRPHHHLPFQRQEAIPWSQSRRTGTARRHLHHYVTAVSSRPSGRTVNGIPVLLAPARNSVTEAWTATQLGLMMELSSMACCLMLCARWRSVSLHQLLNPPRRELTAAGAAQAAAGSGATAEAAVEVEAAAAAEATRGRGLVARRDTAGHDERCSRRW